MHQYELTTPDNKISNYMHFHPEATTKLIHVKTLGVISKVKQQDFSYLTLT